MKNLKRETAEEIKLSNQESIIILGEKENYKFGLVSLFNGISTFVGYLMPKPLS